MAAPATSVESAPGADEPPDWQSSLTLTSTFRLRLRKFMRTDVDARDYFQIFSNPNICKFDDFDPIDRKKARSDVDGIVDNYTQGAVENEYAVELKSRGKVIGALSSKEEDGAIYIGYHFNEKYHGKGYALEAMAAFLFWLLKHNNCEIRAVTDTQNERSINLLLKIGFEFVQTVSKVIDGQPVNEFIYRYVGAFRLQS
jgi:ribosomal-protein-alanine N-acetyltransferase